MGQQVSSECSCRESILGLCAPEDPCKEAQNTLHHSPTPGAYPMPTLSERDIGGIGGMDMQVRLGGGGGFDFTSDDVAFIAAPPPLYASHPMSWSSGRSTPRRQEPVTQKATSPPRRDVTVEDILSDLESSEETLYGEAFAMFPGGLSGFVGLDSAGMRDFLCTNSAISMDTVDMELLIQASTDEGLSGSGFVHLLREFSVSDSESIAHFLGLSSNGETLTSEECRTALLLFGQQKLAGNFTDERWETILDTVMWDASMTVTMEQWISYCKLIGRILRLLRYMQVRKLAVGSRSKKGIIGGA